MDEVPLTPHSLITVAYAFAALFALGASAFWFRFYDPLRKSERAGGLPTFRWLAEAANGTGLALGLAALTFLYSLFV